MWWQPQNETEASITRFLARLAERFDVNSAPFIRGFGSTPHGKSRARLVVLDKHLHPNLGQAPFNAFLGQIDDFRRLFAALGFPVAPFDRDDIHYPISEAGENARALLAPFDPPSDTLIAFADPPKALRRRPRIRVWGPDGKDATIGFLLGVGDRVCATTAGHLVSGLPCEIVTRHAGCSGCLRPRFLNASARCASTTIRKRRPDPTSR